jgi:hypothetical protein
MESRRTVRARWRSGSRAGSERPSRATGSRVYGGPHLVRRSCGRQVSGRKRDEGSPLLRAFGRAGYRPAGWDRSGARRRTRGVPIMVREECTLFVCLEFVDVVLSGCGSGWLGGGTDSGSDEFSLSSWKCGLWKTSQISSVTNGKITHLSPLYVILKLGNTIGLHPIKILVTSVYSWRVYLMASSYTQPCSDMHNVDEC